MEDTRLALVQCTVAAQGDPAANLRTMDRALAATAPTAALTAFPELSLSGCVTAPEAVASRALALDSPLIREAVALTAKYRTWAGFGFFECGREGVFNSYALAGHGKILGTHRKVHTPARETGLFAAGDRFHVFDLPFARVGLSICYDNEIAESHLVLAQLGAEVILMPTAWADHWEREDYVERCETDAAVVAERKRWMEMMFGARCRDTGTYSALINQVGPEEDGPWRFVGKSMAFAPTGRVIAAAAAWEPQILYAELSGRLLADYRAMDCYAMKNRRPAAYGPLHETPEGPPS